MKALVIGTQNSGKSTLAEELALRTGNGKRYYAATMIVCDDAGRERVRKHRREREGKGFITIERGTDITGILDGMEDARDAVVLLEYMANLVGQEMYRTDCLDPEQFAESIMRDVRSVADSVGSLIIVTDEYEKDGEGYTDSTRLYVKLLDLVNAKLMEYADVVYDVRKKNSGRGAER